MEYEKKTLVRQVLDAPWREAMHVDSDLLGDEVFTWALGDGILYAYHAGGYVIACDEQMEVKKIWKVDL